MSDAQANAIPIELAARQAHADLPASEDPLARLCESYTEDYKAVASYLYRRTGDHDLAGELACETYAHALASLSRWANRGIPIRAWLLGIATRRLSHHDRRLARRARAFTFLRAGSAPQSTTTPRSDDESSRLRTAIADLPHAAQDALYLHHVEGLSLRDVSSILAVPEGTLKSRLARARDQLARALETSPNHQEHRHGH